MATYTQIIIKLQNKIPVWVAMKDPREVQKFKNMSEPSLVCYNKDYYIDAYEIHGDIVLVRFPVPRTSRGRVMLAKFLAEI